MDEQSQSPVMSQAPSDRPEETRPPEAAVVELLGRDGHAVQVQRVLRWPVRIGRSPACDIVLDDAHLAAEHAELHFGANGVQLRLLASRNGGGVAGQVLAAGAEAMLPVGGAFQLGGSSLRLRTSADSLAPEQLLAVQPPRHWAWLWGLLMSMLCLQWLDRWSGVDPDSRWIDYAAPLLGPLAFVLAWAGLWSLGSQIFQHRFPFVAHLRRVLTVIVVLQLLDWLLPAVAYAFSWPRLMVLDALSAPLAGGVLVAWHAHLVWPGARRLLNGGVAVLLLLGLGLQAGNRQEQQHVFGPPYLSSLPPPALRLAPTKSPQALVESLKPLQAELAKQARKDNEGVDVEDLGE